MGALSHVGCAPHTLGGDGDGCAAHARAEGIVRGVEGERAEGIWEDGTVGSEDAEGAVGADGTVAEFDADNPLYVSAAAIASCALTSFERIAR